MSAWVESVALDLLNSLMRGYGALFDYAIGLRDISPPQYPAQV